MKRVALLTSFLPNLSPPAVGASTDELYKYCGENSGNVAFTYGIVNQLANPITFLPWHFDPSQVQKIADIIVMPCANQLGTHLDLGWLGERLEKAGLPIVAIGLGAQAPSQDKDVEINEGTLRWVKVISESSIKGHANISVRGKYTRQQLEKNHIKSTEVLGCPSLFINSTPHLGKKIQEDWSSLPKRICIAGGHHRWREIASLEQQLVALIHDPYYPGAYICQSTLDNLRISRAEFEVIEPEVLNVINAYICPHLSLDEFKTWCKTYAYSFYDVPTWMEFLRKYDLTVGPRYHGAALALQAGRMGVTIPIDSRTEELCQTTGVPYIKAEALEKGVTRQILYNLVNFNPEAFDVNRIELARKYIAFLQKNDLTPSQSLMSIVKMTAPC